MFKPTVTRKQVTSVSRPLSIFTSLETRAAQKVSPLALLAEYGRGC